MHFTGCWSCRALQAPICTLNTLSGKSEPMWMCWRCVGGWVLEPKERPPLLGAAAAILLPSFLPSCSPLLCLWCLLPSREGLCHGGGSAVVFIGINSTAAAPRVFHCFLHGWLRLPLRLTLAPSPDASCSCAPPGPCRRGIGAVCGSCGI